MLCLDLYVRLLERPTELREETEMREKHRLIFELAEGPSLENSQ